MASGVRKEHGLRVSEKKALRKRDCVTGDWRRLHNKELNDLFCSPNVIQMIKSRRMRWAGHVTYKGERRGAYRVLLGKPERKKLLGRARHRGKDTS